MLSRTRSPAALAPAACLSGFVVGGCDDAAPAGAVLEAAAAFLGVDRGEPRVPLERVELESLVEWACSRQMVYEGGFSGRPNKLVDSCYSFWQGGLLTLQLLPQRGEVRQGVEGQGRFGLMLRLASSIG